MGLIKLYSLLKKCLKCVCGYVSSPSLLPFRVVSDESLWGREPIEFKLSRESSLLGLPPPLPPRWWSFSLSEYQLSPKPLSLAVLLLWLDDSCRVFHTHTQEHAQIKRCQLKTVSLSLSPRSPRQSEKPGLVTVNTHYHTGYTGRPWIKSLSFSSIHLCQNKQCHDPHTQPLSWRNNRL